MLLNRKPIYPFAILLLLMASCTVIKNYPTTKRFVAANQIEIYGPISKDEKNRLAADLNNYWDDSLRVKSSDQLFVIKRIKNPAVYDSNNIARSEVFMKAYLASNGYYNAVFKDTLYKIVPSKHKNLGIFPKYKNGLFRRKLSDSLKIIGVKMKINVGKNLKIDSTGVNLIDSSKHTATDTLLQQLANKAKKESVLKKGNPYSKQIVSLELDRLVALYRKNGFYRYSRENLYADVDTIDLKLLDFTLDPFGQAKKIAEAVKRRKENPEADIIIRPRKIADSTKTQQYYVGNLYFYPETKVYEDEDSLIYLKNYRVSDTNRAGYVLKDKLGKFHFRPIRSRVFMRKGALYNEDDYYRTVNSLSGLGAWQQVDVKPVILRTATDSNLIDFHFFLIPAPKRSRIIDFETSRNTGDIASGGVSLFGIANSITLIDRNVWKEAIQANTTLRNGVELNFTDKDKLLQTIQSSLSHSYTFPRLIAPNWMVKRQKRLENPRTVFNLNASYTDRKNYFLQRSFAASWGYEWVSKLPNGRKNNWIYRPLDIGISSLESLPLLEQAFKDFPALRTAFNTGKVISQNLTYFTQFNSNRKPNHTHNFKFSIEEAGGLLGLIPTFQNDIYQYLKLTGEYKALIKKRKNAIAYRFFAGVGFNYSKDSIIGNTLPFFKQFTAGGPNSMRAWQVRQLGLGSSIVSDTAAKNTFKDRFGDVQLEANVEYRFRLADVGGVKLDGALFADVGNIWNIKKDTSSRAINTELNFARLYNDVAIAAGFGLRIDFSNFFLIRLDLGYKLKDPARQTPGGWLKNLQFSETRNNGANGIEVTNMAIQLGIGLPF